MDSYLTNAKQFAIMVEIGYLFYIDVYKNIFVFSSSYTTRNIKSNREE